MNPVTDPKLLAQLEGTESSESIVKKNIESMTPVTDPHILAQLEGTQDSQQPHKKNIGSIIDPRNAFPSQQQGLDMILGGGDAIRNQMANIGNVFPGVNIPMARSSEGKNYDIGHMAGDIAGFMGGGAVLSSSKIANLLSKMPISGALSRIGATSGYGAIQSPEDRSKGAITGALMGGVGESIPLALKGIGGLAEKINPINYTKSAMGTIENLYKSHADEAKGIYKNLEQEYGKDVLFNPDKVPKLSKKNIVSEIHELNNFYKQFKKKPTFENLQNFQKQIGSEIRKLKEPSMNKDIDWLQKIKKLETVRDRSQNALSSHIKKNDISDFKQYEKARGIFRDILPIHHESDLLENIVKGRMNPISEKIETLGMGKKISPSIESRKIQPEELLGELHKISEKVEFPKNHYLRIIQKELSDKINTGKGINDLGSILTGAGIGQALMPGLGAAGGALIGSAASKTLNPAMISIAQNPAFLKGLDKLNKIYKPGKSIATGYALSEK